MKDVAEGWAEMNRQKQCFPGFWFTSHHLLSATTVAVFFCMVSAVRRAPLGGWGWGGRPSSVLLLLCAANRDGIASTKI